MTAKEILKDYIVRELIDGRKVTLNEEDDLLRQGMLTSLDILRLIYFIEKQFNIQIPQEDVTVKRFRTISTIADYLEKYEQARR